MADEVSIIMAQTESAEESTDATEDAVETEQESTDTGEGGDAGTVEGDKAEGGNTEAEDAVEGGDQSSSSEAYADFSLPEGLELDTALLGKATPLFKEAKLTQEMAQKFVDLQAEQIQASQQGQVEAFNQLKTNWQEQTKNDPDIGGDNFDQSVSDARVAVEKFGTPELTKLLNDFGMGNHPEVIRFMSKVGVLLKEDVPGATGGATTQKKDRVSILYPDSN